MNKDNYRLFVKYCCDIFSYLKTIYKFNLLKPKEDIYGCIIIFKKQTIEIVISYSSLEGEIAVIIKYEPKWTQIIPYYPRYYELNINHLTYLYTSKYIEQDKSKIYQADFGYIKSILERYSETLKLYANEILNGDISWFKKIEKLKILKENEENKSN